MGPYRPQASDLTPDADRAQFERYRTWTPAQSIQRTWELNEWAWSRARVGIRRDHPHASEREIELRFAAWKYGREWVIQQFGWDPEGGAPLDGIP